MKITKRQQEQLERFAKRHNIFSVCLFGSQAKNKAREGSDFDVAVESEKPLALKEELIIISELSKIFPGQEIDLTNTLEAPLALKFRIYRDGQLLFTSNRQKHIKEKVKTFSSYFDRKYYIDRLTDISLKRISKEGL